MEKKVNDKWLIALLLCLFLGSLGIHRFFVGKTQTGIAMLLITLLLGWILGLGVVITGVWALIDLIMIACSKFTDAQGNIIYWQV